MEKERRRPEACAINLFSALLQTAIGSHRSLYAYRSKGFHGADTNGMQLTVHVVWPEIWEKNIAQILEKIAKTSAKPKKCQNIFIEGQLKSPKHQHQTPSRILKYLQQTMFSPKNCLGL
jgi:hypothetical protein